VYGHVASQATVWLPKTPGDKELSCAWAVVVQLHGIMSPQNIELLLLLFLALTMFLWGVRRTFARLKAHGNESVAGLMPGGWKQISGQLIGQGDAQATYRQRDAFVVDAWNSRFLSFLVPLLVGID
jgi:hypothetical protein